ncbi:RebB family R body protein [Mucilaginibacter gotjawali]|uniref:Uncharacterized protein n=2 Tax=Mucilaginibacter gotjawali TaxID=1550579 RepID=A0A839SJS5_9SPHI|nr:RebB family R body protein [Mucilaginibacter gotjawali]MBB3057688.1 hypothetical protein [Mucilaginibacter gotjawali]BAU52491.1 Killing trait [Mucilaginibacter gotjawali]
MPDSTNTLPEQIIETSRAFTQTLEMENAVFSGQVNGAIEMTVHAFGELIALCKAAIAVANVDVAGGKQKLAETAQQALSDVQHAAGQPGSPPTEITPAEAMLDSAVLQAVGQSYQNAVTAQQQMYITQQAAATQIIATILSVATATLGVAVKEAESEGH